MDSRRIQSTSQFVSMSVMPLAPVLAGALLAVLGGEVAVAVLGVLTMGVALIPTLSASVRAVPRPAVWREREVPPILLSGNHGAIASWRRAQQLERTARVRPDLLP